MSRNKNQINNKKLKRMFIIMELNIYKKYHIINYQFNKNILIYIYNNVVITILIHYKEIYKTESIPPGKTTNFNNACIICHEKNKGDYKGCPCCVNFYW